ncbi:MAG TPA: O-methyltransferase [Mycobacteriales bacterium]|nr:O-methyltransferase [Mycobacteriales bacterium]
MSDSWTAVDHLLESFLLPEDEALAAALAAAAQAGLPPIQVPPVQGRFLHLLARSISARRMLEFGTLGAYSTIWLARALPAGGTLTTLELNPAYAEVARANLERAGVGDRVDVRVGPAAESLPSLDGETFDLTFIDADKPSTADYFDWSVEHTRSGGVIIVDNVVRRGGILDEATAGDDAANVGGIRRFLAAAGNDRRVEVTALQTVGSKGHDGFALAVVN